MPKKYKMTDESGKAVVVTVPDGMSPEEAATHAFGGAPSVPTDGAPPGVALGPETKPNPPVPYEGEDVDYSSFINPSRTKRLMQNIYGSWIQPFVPPNPLGLPHSEYKKADRKRHVESRSWPGVAGEVGAFTGSLPVRILTGGRHGLGSIPGLGFIGDAERSFMRANEPQFKALGSIGMSSLYAGGRPRALGAMYLPRPRARVSSRARQSDVDQDQARSEPVVRSIDERAHLLNDMDDLGIEPYAPALLPEGGLSYTVNMLQKLPMVGYPLMQQSHRVLDQTKDAALRIAQRYGNRENSRGAGQALQEGIENYRERFQEAAHQAYQDALGNLPTSLRYGRVVPGHPRLTGSAPHTTRRIQEIIKERLGGVGIGHANIQVGKVGRPRTPDQEPTGFHLALEQKPNAVPFASSDPGEAFRRMALGEYTATLEGMRGTRTNLRQSTAGARANPTEGNASSVGYARALTSTLTQDTRGIAENAAIKYRAMAENRRLREVNQDPSEVVPKGNKVGPKKVAEFNRRADLLERANLEIARSDDYYREHAQILDRLKPLWKDSTTPEAAFERLSAMSKNKGSQRDLAGVQAIARNFEEHEMGAVASGLLHHMGMPVASAGGSVRETGWSVMTWSRNWNAMDDAAKDALFGAAGTPLRDELNKLARVSNRMADFEKHSNWSQTFNHAAAALLLGTGAGYGGPTISMWSLAYGGLGFATSWMMTRPRIVRAMRLGLAAERDATLSAPVRRQRVNVQLGRIAESIRNDGELRAVLVRAIALSEAKKEDVE